MASQQQQQQQQQQQSPPVTASSLPPPQPPIAKALSPSPSAAAAVSPVLHRPPFAHPNPQSPGNVFPSPSPQSFSPQFNQPPAAKRPRLSPDAGSPFHAPSQVPVTTAGGPSVSPVGAVLANGMLSQNRSGSMPPPQRPAERERGADRLENENDVSHTVGIGANQEQQNLTASNMFPGASLHNRPGAQGSVGYGAGQQQPNGGQAEAESIPQPTPEQIKARLEARADWEASRHRQFPLWDMFLYGGPLNDRIREKSQQERLHDPQAGVLVNTQRTGPPPRARVNGFEGATREIDKGQAILDSGAKGERLREIMSIISLATKTRLTGILNASARLAIERRQHSKGQAPAEWADVAVAQPGQEAPTASSGSTAVKRTHSQANAEPVTATFQKLAQAEKAEEEARRAKRAKRKHGTAGTTSDTPGTPDVAAMEAAVAAESTQKMTKKAQKEMAGRAAEQVAHASANEAARLAISGMLGSRFGGKKNRTYDWMTAGRSGTSTPTRVASSSTPGSLAGTPSAARTQAQAKDNKFQAWDESKEPGIQVRDVLMVLESDARAPKTYLKAVEKIKD